MKAFLPLVGLGLLITESVLAANHSKAKQVAKKKPASPPQNRAPPKKIPRKLRDRLQKSMGASKSEVEVISDPIAEVSEVKNGASEAKVEAKLEQSAETKTEKKTKTKTSKKKAKAAATQDDADAAVTLISDEDEDLTPSQTCEVSAPSHAIDPLPTPHTFKALPTSQAVKALPTPHTSKALIPSYTCESEDWKGNILDPSALSPLECVPPVWIPRNASVAESIRSGALPAVISRCVNPTDIALTFDDGLHSVTASVLDLLKAESIPATFFIQGNSLERTLIGDHMPQSLLKRMLAEGHTIASHSYSHPDFNTYEYEGIKCEMDKTAGLFRELAGKVPRFMRPPYGNVNKKTQTALHDLGYFIIRWNLDTNDWRYPDDEYQIACNFGKGASVLAQKKLPAVVLMHDTHASTPAYLSEIIQRSRNLGYNFVNMEQCLGGIDPYFAENAD